MSTHQKDTFFCTTADVIIEKIGLNEETFTHAYLDTYVLSSNQVTSLIKSIETNNHLKYINLFDCRIDDRMHDSLIEALNKNKTISTVIINRDIGAELYSRYMDSVKDGDSIISSP